MNTPEVVAAIVAPTTLALAGLMLMASAKEWVNITVAFSVKFIPAAKRRPRTAVELINVIPGAVEQPAAPSIAAARRPA